MTKSFRFILNFIPALLGAWSVLTIKPSGYYIALGVVTVMSIICGWLQYELKPKEPKKLLKEPVAMDYCPMLPISIWNCDKCYGCTGCFNNQVCLKSNVDRGW